jgi:flagellar biosynthesis chaperone FliJ|tara:strand:+ start:273 stop:731 length:459 start_codon:yes stop_codon:yes gene_type:complete
MSKQLKSSIQRWDTLAEGVGQKVNEVQKVLILVRDKQTKLDGERTKLGEMKREYVNKLKEVQVGPHDMEKVTYLRRFLGQLDVAVKAIAAELEVLAIQNGKIQEQFRSLNSEKVKFTTLACRSRKQLQDLVQRADQKDQDMMNVMRFEALKR